MSCAILTLLTAGLSCFVGVACTLMALSVLRRRTQFQERAELRSAIDKVQAKLVELTEDETLELDELAQRYLIALANKEPQAALAWDLGLRFVAGFAKWAALDVALKALRQDTDLHHHASGLATKFTTWGKP